MSNYLKVWLTNNLFFICKAKKFYFITGILLFLSTLVLLSHNINKPFVGEHDWNGARYGNIARNYLRYGLIGTRMGQVENSGIAYANEFKYFTHYPPLLPLLIAISYKIFGISEWSTRLITTLATSAILVLIFLIGKNLFNFTTGLFSAILLSVTPQVLYFGKNPVHEPLVVMFVLLAFLGYLEKKKWIFYFGLVAGELTTWAGYFIVVGLTISALIKRDFDELRKLRIVWIVSAVVFLLHIVHTYLVTGDLVGGDLIGVFLQRSALSESGQVEGLNFFNYLYRLRLWISSLYSFQLILLSIIGFILILKQGLQKSLYMLSLLIFGLTYFLLFPNSSYIHNYLTFYLLPFIGLSAGVAVNELWEMKSLSVLSYIIPVLIIFIIFFERSEYLQALRKSEMDKLAWEIGVSINKQTELEDKVLIMPESFKYSSDKFLGFYSDRVLMYSDVMNSLADIVVKIDINSGKFQIIK